jgi:hypothetical protein
MQQQQQQATALKDTSTIWLQLWTMLCCKMKKELCRTQLAVYVCHVQGS